MNITNLKDNPSVYLSINHSFAEGFQPARLKSQAMQDRLQYVANGGYGSGSLYEEAGAIPPAVKDTASLPWSNLSAEEQKSQQQNVYNKYAAAAARRYQFERLADASGGSAVAMLGITLAGANGILGKLSGATSRVGMTAGIGALLSLGYSNFEVKKEEANMSSSNNEAFGYYASRPSKIAQ